MKKKIKYLRSNIKPREQEFLFTDGEGFSGYFICSKDRRTTEWSGEVYSLGEADFDNCWYETTKPTLKAVKEDIQKVLVGVQNR